MVLGATFGIPYRGGVMKVSLVIPVLDSHEIVRRQLLHFTKSQLPSDVEVIIVDDGSEPLIAETVPWHEVKIKHLRIIATRDSRPWTSALARNKGAQSAMGDYLFMTDIDHVVTRDLIEEARSFGGDRLSFKRQFGILDPKGNLKTDASSLKAWGVSSRFKEPGKHGNSFCMRASLFHQLGRYSENRFMRPFPTGEDRIFNRRYWDAVDRGECKNHEYAHTPLYLIPNGRFCGDDDANPFGLFHGLSRKQEAS